MIRKMGENRKKEKIKINKYNTQRNNDFLNILIYTRIIFCDIQERMSKTPQGTHQYTSPVVVDTASSHSAAAALSSHLAPHTHPFHI